VGNYNFSLLSNESSLEILKQSSHATAIYTGEDLRIQLANNAMLKIWGKDQSVVGKNFEDALPEMIGKPFTQLLKNVWITSETYEAREMPATLEQNGIMFTSYFDFIYKPILDQDGKIYCILHTAVDVSERVAAWKIVREKQENEERINHDLEAANKELVAINEEYQTSNEKLAALNEEYTVTNEHLEKANKTISLLNQGLDKENKDFLFDNKNFQDNVSDLNYSNSVLEARNEELKRLNDTINSLNIKITDSETSFVNLIAQAPVAMLLVKGDDFIVSLINQPMLDLIGKDVGIIGKPLFDELPELKGQQAADMLINTYKKGQPHAELSNPVLLKRNGKLEKGYYNFNYMPFIEDGKITGVIDMATDVTPQFLAIQERERIINEKSELEQTLKNSEQRLHGILETMAEGVGVVDASGQLVYANPMAQQILGLSETSIKSRTYDDPKWQNLRLDGSPLPSEEHPMSIMMSSGKPVFDHEIGVQPPDRERIYISINAAPIFDSEGRLTGGIGTFMDVTARRMITQGKDDFISIASHELKTPVTALKIALQLLERSHEKLSLEVRTKLIDQSVKSLDKLSRLIDELLDTSRMEQGHLKLHKTIFSMAELFDECLSILFQKTDRKITFEGDTSIMVEADNQQIGQVMVNFISNAIKYAPDSDIVVKVHLLNDDHVKITIKDNGPGIPEEKVGHLFERYYRTDYRGQKFSGLGLGLYISAEIIRNHGGDIGVESQLGKGSEFWFTLPLQ